MRLALCLWLLVAWCDAAIALNSAGRSIVDDDGRPILLGSPAVRVVTLAPSLTELVYAAGAGDKLVAVSAFSDYPPEAKQLPVVASSSGIAWESLLVQKPDLVLAWKGGTRQADIAKLNSLNIPVFALDVSRLADIPRALRAIGHMVGRVDAAERAAATFERELQRLEEGSREKKPLRVFVEISSRPLLTVNGRHVLSEALARCGGVNSFADAPQLTPEPNREELLKRAPDVVLYGRGNGSTTREEANAIYRGLRAARENRIYGIEADHAFRPGPRLLLAVAEICKTLDRARASLAANRGK